ncbi:hypothetical protein COJ07_31230, partial [Bacillus cereus]
LYKGGTFIERKLDESDRLERERMQMSIEERVLPKHIKAATELENKRRECVQNQQILYKQMEQANRERNKDAYIELHELYQKQVRRDSEISKELSAM